MVRRWSRVLFSGAQCQTKKHWTQTGIQEVPFEHQEAVFLLLPGTDMFFLKRLESPSLGIFRSCMDIVLVSMLEQMAWTRSNLNISVTVVWERSHNSILKDCGQESVASLAFGI